MAADAPARPAPPIERAERRVRELVTPEGVDLQVVLGEAGQRAAAFLIDMGIILGALVAATLICIFAGMAAHNIASLEVIVVIWLLVFFLLRNLYFVGFEMRPRAATPGKRAMGLRVAARNGGRLTADAVFARNAMREIEFYLPLSFLLADASGIDAWIVLAGLVWCGVFVLMPLFNRDRLRAGDLVAGTWVVQAPKRRLLKDLTDRYGPPPRFAFTPAQLDAYGIKELQVLEDVLRQNNMAVVAAVATRIRAKIGWQPDPAESDWEFLDAYYPALRHRLESGLLFGRRRRDKHDRG